MLKTLYVIIGENKSATIEKRSISRTLSTTIDVTDISNTLNKQ